jgi:hypothetical protein
VRPAALRAVRAARRAARAARCLAALAALFALAACRAPVPELLPLPADDPRPARLLAGWQAAASARQGLRGRARLAVDAQGGELQLRGQQILVVMRPARLRVEVQGLLGQTVAVLVTDGERYELFRADTHDYQTGAVHADLLWEHAWLALAPEEAVELLLGAPTPGADLVPGAAWTDAEGGVRFELVDAEGRPHQRARFDALSRLRGFEQLDFDGELAWRAEFDAYADVAGRPFAHHVSVEVPHDHSRAEIELRDVELDPAVSPDVFRLR